MWGFTGVAGHRALSAGTLLIAGGGLALYQMTSLVLGPAGSRQLHVSLSIPSFDQDELSQPWSSSGDFAVGALATPASATSVSAPWSAGHRASSTPAAHRPAAPVQPVASQPPTTGPSAHPTAPIAGPSDQQAGAHQGDNRD